MPVRDASTVIVLRRDGAQPRVLMGQRGATAAFMPNKFVFPGGRVDETDADVRVDPLLNATCLARLEKDADGSAGAEALAAAAIRELWEETGLILGRPHGGNPGDIASLPDWQSFAAAGYRPAAEGMRFVFRAITPLGRPRRFDARFFLIGAEALQGDPDDFSRAGDELSHLSWVPLCEARKLDLPFITRTVLAELEARLHGDGEETPVPFFDNRGPTSRFLFL